jgi:16S rRNA processing protein RimM
MTKQPDTPPNDLILIGHIRDAFSIHGWIKVYTHSNQADTLVNTKIWWLQKIAQRDMAKQNTATQPDLNSLQSVEITQTKVHIDHIVAQIKGCTTRNQAETYKGQQIWISRAAFPETDDDEHYWVDLIGMHVINQQGESLGTISELSDNGAHDIIHVTEQATEHNQTPTTRLIPYVDAYILNIDDEKREILVDWGLDY